MDSEESEDQIEYLLSFDSGDFAKDFCRVLRDDVYNGTKKSEQLALLIKLTKASGQGHEKAIGIFEQMRAINKERYRFEWLVRELACGQPAACPEYKGGLLKLINSVVEGCATSIDRRLVMNEFLGLRIGEVFKQLRSEKGGPPALLVNEMVRFEENYRQEEEPNADIDVNQHTNIFYAILQRIKETPTEARFLFCLQSLLQIEAFQTWEYVARFLDKLATLDDKNKLDSLLKSEVKIVEGKSQTGNEPAGPCKLNGCTCSCHQGSNVGASSPSFRLKVMQREMEEGAHPPTVHPPLPPPPPPPPPPPFFLPPPPPPPPLSNSHNPSIDAKSAAGGRKLPQIPTTGAAGLPPPTPALNPPPPPLAAAQVQPKIAALLPTPKKRLKRFQWNKIPAGAVLGKKNIWTTGGLDVLRGPHQAPLQQQQQQQPELSIARAINFEAIESMFALRESPVNVPSAGDERDGKPEVKKRKLEEVCLLDSKRSLNVNIFLHQIRYLHKDLICRILSGDSSCLSIEKMKGLLRILPDQNEMELIRSYKGDPAKLGNAEKFYLDLSNFPNFSSCVEALLTKEEFGQITDSVKPALDSYILTAQDIRDSKLLQEIFQTVLITGNFLNSGGFAGDAVGFKLSSLLNLTELKSNEPGLTLMHFIAQNASEKNPKLLKLPEQLKWLKETSQYSWDSIMADVATLTKRVETVKKHLDHVNEEMRRKLDTFLEVAEKELEEIEEKRNELDALRRQLAEYFCEDERSFNVDEMVKIIGSFVERFEKAVTENSKRYQRAKSKEHHVTFRRQSSLPRETDKSRRLQKCMSENFQEKVDLPLFRQTSEGAPGTSSERETPPVHQTPSSAREGERKVRQTTTTGDEELMELLYSGSTSSIDTISRSRRKLKTQFSSAFVDGDRERTPDLDVRSAFVRNKGCRKTMIDFRASDRNRFSEIFNSFPHIDADENSISPSGQIGIIDGQTDPVKSNSSFQNGDQSLTELAFLKHIESKRKPVEAEPEPSRLDSTRQKIAEYRQREAMESSSSAAIGGIFGSVRQSRASVDHSAPRERQTGMRESRPTGDRRTFGVVGVQGEEIKFRKSSSSEDQCSSSDAGSVSLKSRSSEIESVCSGTDEGFESMRNSVVDESCSRVSPQTQSLTNSEESSNNNSSTKNINNHCSSNSNYNNKGIKVDSNTNEKKTCTNGDGGHALTRSCGNLMQAAPLAIVDEDETTRLQGASSMLAIDAKDVSRRCDGQSLEGMTKMSEMSANYIDLRDLSAPKESSTSTLKSSNSGLHIRVADDQQADSIDGHLQIPASRQRTSSMSDQSNSSDSKRSSKPPVNIDQLTARLSQPKRFLGTSTHSVGQPSVAKKTVPQKPFSIEAFVRGSTGRSTLPPNMLNINKKKASAQHHANQQELNSTVISEGPSFSMTNLEDTPPKPPLRTTSISTSDSLNGTTTGRRLTLDNHSQTRGPAVSLNTTIACSQPSCSEPKAKAAEKSASKVTPEKPTKQSRLKNLLKGSQKSPKTETSVGPEESSVVKLTRPSKPGTTTRYKR